MQLFGRMGRGEKNPFAVAGTSHASSGDLRVETKRDQVGQLSEVPLAAEYPGSPGTLPLGDLICQLSLVRLIA